MLTSNLLSWSFPGAHKQQHLPAAHVLSSLLLLAALESVLCKSRHVSLPLEVAARVLKKLALLQLRPASSKVRDQIAATHSVGAKTKLEHRLLITLIGLGPCSFGPSRRRSPIGFHRPRSSTSCAKTEHGDRQACAGLSS